jgi:hypothetical protein
MITHKRYRKLKRTAASFVLANLTLTSGPLYGIFAIPFPLSVSHEEIKASSVSVLSKESASDGNIWHDAAKSLSTEVAQNGDGNAFTSLNSAFFGTDTAVTPSASGAGEEAAVPATEDATSASTTSASVPDINDFATTTPSEDATATPSSDTSISGTPEVILQPQADVPDPSDSSSTSETASAFLEKLVAFATQPLTAEAQTPAASSSASTADSAPYLEYSDFSFDGKSDASTTEPSSLDLNVSLAGAALPGATLSLQYSTDTITWLGAGNISFDAPQSNALHKGYFSFALPSSIANDLSLLKIRLAYTYPDGSSPSLSIDSVWLDAAYGRSFLSWLQSAGENVSSDLLYTDDASFDKLEFSSASFALSLPGDLSNSFTIGETAPLHKQLRMALWGANASTTAERKGDTVTYTDAFPSTDLTYDIATTGLKENIILKDADHPDSYVYLMNLKDFDWTEVNLHQIDLYRKGKKDDPLFKLYTVNAPYMEDATGARSSAVDLSVNGDLLVVTPDAAWLKSAAYPVTVDPSVVISVLNVHSHPVQGGTWNIEFVTNGQADLAITPGDPQTTRDMQFSELACNGITEDPDVSSSGVVTYKGWSCEGIGTVIYNDVKSGNHHQIFTFGDATADAFNGNVVWSGADGDGKWSNSANWAGGVVPGASDMAVFDTSCGTSCNATIDTNADVGGVSILSGYPGTITQSVSTTVTIESLGFSQAGGIYNGSAGWIFQDNGSFAMSGGTFTPPSSSGFFASSGYASGDYADETNWNVGNDFAFTGGTINGSNGNLALNGITGTVFSCMGDVNSATNLKSILIAKSVTSGTAFQLSSGCTLSGSMHSGSIPNGESTVPVEIDGTFNTVPDTYYFAGNGSGYTWYSGTGVVTVTGTLNFTGDHGSNWLSGPLVISDGGTVRMTGTNNHQISYVSNASMDSIDIQDGTLDATGLGEIQTTSINIDGVSSTYDAAIETHAVNWTNNGTFNNNQGLVLINGSSNNATILGSSAFYNLTEQGTVIFGSAGTQKTTVQNEWTARGTLRSDNPGTQWRIDPQGTRYFFNTNIQDSDNVNTAVIYTYGEPYPATSFGGNINSGNNIGWNFTQFFTVSVHPNPIVWSGAGGDGKWSNSANWAGGVVPGRGDVAKFDSTCGANCNTTIDTNVFIAGLYMDSTYTGTITQGSGKSVTIGALLYDGTTQYSYGFTQKGGTFIAGDSPFIINDFARTANGSNAFGKFAITGGTFTGGTGALKLVDTNFSISSGTFTAPSGEWDVDGNFTFSGGTILGTGKILNLSSFGTILNQNHLYGQVFTCTGNFNSVTGLTVATDKILTGNDYSNTFSDISGSGTSLEM